MNKHTEVEEIVKRWLKELPEVGSHDREKCWTLYLSEIVSLYTKAKEEERERIRAYVLKLQTVDRLDGNGMETVIRQQVLQSLTPKD